MTKAEAATVGRIISEVATLQSQLYGIESELRQIKRVAIEWTNDRRRLIAEKATLVESIALLTLRAQGLPITGELPSAPVGHGG